MLSYRLSRVKLSRHHTVDVAIFTENSDIATAKRRNRAFRG